MGKFMLNSLEGRSPGGIFRGLSEEVLVEISEETLGEIAERIFGKTRSITPAGTSKKNYSKDSWRNAWTLAWRISELIKNGFAYFKDSALLSLNLL